MNKLSSEYIVDIINQKMAMPPGTVILRDTTFEYPNSQGLFIVCGVVNSFVMGAETFMRAAVPRDWDEFNQRWDLAGQTYDTDLPSPLNYDRGGEDWDVPNQTFDQLPPTQIEVNQVLQQEWVQIDVASKNQDAMRRNFEVIAALNSFYAQNVQETNSFKIFRIPRGPINTSAAEGGSFLNRYTITIPCFVWYRKETILPSGDYYDDFHTQVDDEKTLGTDTPLIKFEINAEGIQP